MKKLYIILSTALFGIASCKTEQKIPTIEYSKEVVSKPIPFAEGIISTTENSEFELTFSIDGLKTYFSRREPKGKQMIYVSDFDNGKWTKPRLAEFSNNRDETALITPNGKFLFFGSERPIPNQPNKGNFDMNIWMMEKTDNGWSEPKPISEPINEVQIENEEWVINRKLHREDGPINFAEIVYYDNGQIRKKKWYLNGELHQEDGPINSAVI